MKLLPSTVLMADIGSEYSFPNHITPTDFYPDLAWWYNTKRSLYLVKLTVCFESNFVDAALSKSVYSSLKQAQAKGFPTTLATLEVGSHGVPSYEGFRDLTSHVDKSKKKLHHLLENVCKAAISKSFSIRCSRNIVTGYE